MMHHPPLVRLSTHPPTPHVLLPTHLAVTIPFHRIAVLQPFHVNTLLIENRKQMQKYQILCNQTNELKRDLEKLQVCTQIVENTSDLEMPSKVRGDHLDIFIYESF